MADRNQEGTWAPLISQWCFRKFCDLSLFGWSYSARYLSHSRWLISQKWLIFQHPATKDINTQSTLSDFLKPDIQLDYPSSPQLSSCETASKTYQRCSSGVPESAGNHLVLGPSMAMQIVPSIWIFLWREMGVKSFCIEIGHQVAANNDTICATKKGALMGKTGRSNGSTFVVATWRTQYSAEVFTRLCWHRHSSKTSCTRSS